MFFTIHVFNQLLSTLSGLLAVLSIGMAESWSSPTLPILKNATETIHITNSEGSWLSVMLSIGALSGCLINVIVKDSFGRKRLILVTSICLLTAWLIIAFAQTIALLYIGRFLTGIPTSLAYTVLPLYIGEIAEPKVRGFLAGNITLMHVFGSLLVNSFGCYLRIRDTALIACGFTLLSFVATIWMHESPYYLVMKNQMGYAKESLEKLRGSGKDSEVSRIKEAIELQEEQKGQFMDVFRQRASRRGLFYMFIVLNAQQFNGRIVVTLYGCSIFEEFSNGIISTKTFTILYFSINLLINIVCSFCSDKFGRKPLLVISLVSSTVFLSLIGLYLYFKSALTALSYLPIALFLGYSLFTHFISVVSLVMLSELFCMNVKVFASVLYQMYFTLAVIFIGKLFQICSDSFGLYVPFFFFSVASFVHLILVVIFIPETKGKTLEEIQIQLAKD